MKLMIKLKFLFLAATLCPALLHANETVTYRVLAADKGKVTIVNQKGEVEWSVDNRFDCHDISLLPNGNVLMPVSNTKIVEMAPDKTIVWTHESKPKAPYAGKIEIHGFQRLNDGNTMIAETGNRRIIEVDKEGKIVKEIPITVERPDSHRDTRRVRKLDNGHYLACHEGDGAVREYDETGKVVWTYKLDLAGRKSTPGHQGHGTQVFNAIRLPNGNTVIGGGNNNRVIEVNPAGDIVWSIDDKELPGIQLFSVTGIQALPNGNLIVGNSHAGPANPQIFEVTRDKKVVWQFKDWKNFGNDICAQQVLDTPGKLLR